MTAPIAYGIDFGTTNSSLAIVYEDRVETLPVYPGSQMPACLPSMVYLHRSLPSSAGKEALDRFTRFGNQRTICNSCDLVQVYLGEVITDCRQYSQGKGCQDSRLISDLKTELTSDISHTHSWARDYELADLASVVMQNLKERASSRHPGHEVEKVVLGHPVAFVGAGGPEFEELNERAIQHLRQAAKRAGFKEVEMYPEPVAALDEVLEDGITITVDFGGGTFDTAVVEGRNGAGKVLSMQGAKVGGSMFDALIFDNKLPMHLGLDSKLGAKLLPVPAWFKRRLRNLGNFKHLLTDPETIGIVSDIKKANPRAGQLLDDVIFGGQAGRFYSAIEDAKISLSDNTSTYIEYYSPYSTELTFRIPIHRDEFNQWISRHLEVVKETILRALQEAGITSREVNQVIRTGGSSSIPAFTQMLYSMFGTEIVSSRDIFLSVAYGLGVYAQEIWA